MDVKWLLGAVLGLLLLGAGTVGTEAMQGLGYPAPPSTLHAYSTSRLTFLDIAAAGPPRGASTPRAARLAMSLDRSGEADCSTGFAVLTRRGQGRLLSAEHCDPTGNRRWYGDDGRLLTRGGAAVDVAPDHDSMLIDPVGGTEGYVYGGPWDAAPSDARYRLAVTGAAAPHLGDVVCASGANSGEHCHLRVVDRVLVACLDSLVGVCPAWEVTAPRGQVAAVAGDSGGPVYQDAGTGAVSARGIVNSGAATVRCPATASPPYGRCYRQAFFIGIPELLRYWHVSVQVGDPGRSALVVSVGIPLPCSPGSCAPRRLHKGPARPAPTCRVLRETRLGPTVGTRDPCVQAGHLLRLFAANELTRRRDGYLVTVGRLGRTGLRLVVAGDLAAARRRLAGDRLVEAVGSVGQGP